MQEENLPMVNMGNFRKKKNTEGPCGNTSGTLFLPDSFAVITYIALRFFTDQNHSTAMLARIQSLYLLVAAALALGSMFVPFWSFSSDQLVYLADFGAVQAAGVLQVTASFAAGIFSPLCALVSVATIFLYKNRALQGKLIVLALVLFAADLLSGLTAAHFLNQYIQSMNPGATHKPEPGLFMLLPEPVLFWMAMNAVSKDEKIVNAYKRL
jgi:hypothetical protein